MRLRSILAVGFVSSALDNILSFLGAAGHSLRLVLLRRDDVTSAKILAASIFHSYLNNMVMLFLLPLSLLWLVLGHVVSGGAALSLGFTAGIFIFFLSLGAAIVFINWLRFRVLTVVSIVWHFITRHNITRILTEFDNAMRDGVAALGVKGIAIAFLLLVGDWAFAVIALRFCFAALGDVPRWNILLAGFGFGISAGNVSMIPGGLGIQEASMAGVFAALGANFAQAVLVAILFRVVYDFIPFFVSLAFYRRLMRRHDEPAQET